MIVRPENNFGDRMPMQPYQQPMEDPRFQFDPNAFHPWAPRSISYLAGRRPRRSRRPPLAVKIRFNFKGRGNPNERSTRALLAGTERRRARRRDGGEALAVVGS